MLMVDNVKVMSRNEALEAQNASLKAERSKLKRQVCPGALSAEGGQETARARALFAG
jgi:hypothetical protein